MSSTTGHAFLADHEKRHSESQDERHPFLGGNYKHTQTKCLPSKKVTIFLLVLLSCSVVTNFVFSLRWLAYESLQAEDLDKVCSEYTSESPTPIAEDVKITYRTVEFNGSFAGQNIYRGPPGPEVDEAWLALGTGNRHYIVPEHLGPHYGLDPGHVKRPISKGGGYPVNFEFEHHLHCLNLLRQALHWNFDYYLALGEGPFKNTERILQSHVGHCLDILRQVIMCQPDTGVFGAYFVEDIGEPFVDFNTKHKCKNFDELKDWVTEHQMTVEEFEQGTVLQRPGDVVLPTIP